MKVPVAPTDEEKRRHNLTHSPFREWCSHCVHGRGREDRHGLLFLDVCTVVGSNQQRVPSHDGDMGPNERCG
eukprot:6472615-Amphidinium_carterae.1